jgi:hypothetical protein
MMERPQPARADAKFGAFEMSIAVLNEAASLALSVPYLGSVANIFVQIIRIKGVRCFFPSFFPFLFSLSSSLVLFFDFSRLQERRTFDCFCFSSIEIDDVYRKSICIERCGKR